MNLRDVRLGDLQQVAAINNASATELSYETVAGLRWYRSAAPYFRVAEGVDGDIAAFLIGFRRGDDYHSENLAWFEARGSEDFAYVDRVAVAEFYRGRGLGRRLYDDFEGWARERRIQRLTCEVNLEPLNQGSLDFHARMGWTRVEERQTGYGPKVAMMERILA